MQPIEEGCHWRLVRQCKLRDRQKHCWTSQLWHPTIGCFWFFNALLTIRRFHPYATTSLVGDNPAFTKTMAFAATMGL